VRDLQERFQTSERKCCTVLRVNRGLHRRQPTLDEVFFLQIQIKVDNGPGFISQPQATALYSCAAVSESKSAADPSTYEIVEPARDAVRMNRCNIILREESVAVDSTIAHCDALLPLPLSVFFQQFKWGRFGYTTRFT